MADVAASQTTFKTSHKDRGGTFGPCWPMTYAAAPEGENHCPLLRGATTRRKPLSIRSNRRICGPQFVFGRRSTEFIRKPLGADPDAPRCQQRGNEHTTKR